MPGGRVFLCSRCCLLKVCSEIVEFVPGEVQILLHARHVGIANVDLIKILEHVAKETNGKEAQVQAPQQCPFFFCVDAVKVIFLSGNALTENIQFKHILLAVDSNRTFHLSIAAWNLLIPVNWTHFVDGSENGRLEGLKAGLDAADKYMNATRERDPGSLAVLRASSYIYPEVMVRDLREHMNLLYACQHVFFSLILARRLAT